MYSILVSRDAYTLNAFICAPSTNKVNSLDAPGHLHALSPPFSPSPHCLPFPDSLARPRDLDTERFKLCFFPTFTDCQCSRKSLGTALHPRLRT